MSQPSRRILVHPPSLLSGGPPAEIGTVAAPAGSAASPDATVAADGSDTRKLVTLVEVGQAFSRTLDFQAGLQGVLEVLRNRCGVLRSAVTLLDSSTGDLAITAALGLSSAGRRSRYRLGEGVTGRVAQTGKLMVVPEIGQEPLFLHRAAPRKDRGERRLSFVCVPLMLHQDAVGTLSVELQHKPDRDYERLVQFLDVVAAMMVQALRIQRMIEAEHRRLVEENAHLRQELRERLDFSNIVGTSGPMREVYRQVSQVAGTGTTVLIRGESGTGKELIAQALHYHSPRAKEPFITVNCAALPETLVESELFGHERGAFTGALARKKGRFELADGGTLFLDEVGELNPAAQVKLLRALQEREFERVGGTETVRVDVRVITATNRDLERALAQGDFREDLYYRLNVFPIFVPPLRERRSDILPLAEHFLEKYARAHERSIKRMSTPAIDMLMAYHWPGNVRELENTIERAVLVADGNVIHGHHFSPILQTAEATGTVVSGSLAEAVGVFERNLIEDALKTTRGNRAKAGRLLGTTQRIISYKIRKYGVEADRFRSDG